MSFDNSKYQDTWLRFGYWLFSSYVLFVLVIVVWGIILFPGYVRLHAASYAPNAFWTSMQTQAALRELGWHAETVGWIYFGLDLVMIGMGFSLSFILLRRKTRDGFGLLLAFTFLMGGNTGTVIQPVISQFPALEYFFDNVMGVISWQFFFIALFSWNFIGWVT